MTWTRELKAKKKYLEGRHMHAIWHISQHF